MKLAGIVAILLFFAILGVGGYIVWNEYLFQSDFKNQVFSWLPNPSASGEARVTPSPTAVLTPRPGTDSESEGIRFDSRIPVNQTPGVDSTDKSGNSRVVDNQSLKSGVQMDYVYQAVPSPFAEGVQADPVRVQPTIPPNIVGPDR